MIDVVAQIIDDTLGAHSSVVLTFGVDLPLYDGYLRRKLRSAGVFNQLVFCDHNQYVAELDAVAVLRHFGVGYSVTPVHSSGAFHPKVYLLLGRASGRLVVGSGNATTGGLLRNAEVFGVFEHDEMGGIDPHPAFARIVELIEECLTHATPVARRQWERARTLSPWLVRQGPGDGRALLVGGPGRTPLLDQINEIAGGARAREITVVSASFDRDLEGLRALEVLSDEPVRCVVQTTAVNIDGAAVLRLGDRVRWHAFDDPRRTSARVRGTARAHAKVLVFDRGSDEVVVYGSANASRPALLSSRRVNTEVVVVLAPRPVGTTATELGLTAMLASEDVADSLSAREWTGDDDRETFAWPIILSGVSVESVGLTVCAVGDPALGASLVVAAAPGRPALVVLGVVRERLALRAPTQSIPDGARVAWLIDGEGLQISNPVGLTWVAAASASTSWGLSGRIEDAVFAMQDGEILGTIVFDLLNQVRDFEVVLTGRAGPASMVPGSGQDLAVGPAPRPAAEAFYTDATPTDTPTGWTGDSTDLDLLASLVQPLTRGRRREGDEDEVDDSVALEEAERRALDDRRSKGTGDERLGSGLLATRAALERANRRLVRRLDRSAAALERLLEDSDKLSEIPVAALARQLWMMQLAAFLCGRRTQASDGTDFCCLDPLDFARYTLRTCRVLACGDSRTLPVGVEPRRILRLVASTSWDGSEGEVLRRGLAFAWTCLAWSTATMLAHWELAGPKESASDFTDAVPELVAARFFNEVRRYCDGPDERDLGRRLPAFLEADARRLGVVRESATKLAAVIEDCEVSPPDIDATVALPATLVPGTLVYSRRTGVTVFTGWTLGSQAELLDLDSPSLPIRRFKTGVAILEGARRRSLLWRVPVCLVGDDARA